MATARNPHTNKYLLYMLILLWYGIFVWICGFKSTIYYFSLSKILRDLNNRFVLTAHVICKKLLSWLYNKTKVSRFAKVATYACPA